ncbi:MAG: 5'/3'-nucleotidase SurE [Rhodospirillaceae bacterium]|nr:5'/3'-nucleotidase SurE [Rhodospirillaceae bacterium]|tara:strand:+ start:273 stop:1058 length:786 start_codon:yes stop_codon:yes gene_type:complete
MFEPPLDLKGARILLVNDDGIRAPGLKALERIAKSFSKDVWVFAPEEEQSGAGHSLSLYKPVRVSRISTRRFAVGGSPTDCVMMALTEYMSDKRPDLVLSGVNRGQNLGDDVTYSGTVAGALEATLLGIPAIAMSQQVSGVKVQFKTAETLAPSVIKKLLREKWPADVFMNVNFPDVPAKAVSGVSIVPQGRRKSGYNLHEMPDPRRQDQFYIIGNAIEGQHVGRKDTDYKAIERGEISITPLHCDLTHYGALRSLSKSFG